MSGNSMYIDPAKVADALRSQIPAIVKGLLPAGKQQGNEWCVGDVDGSPGQSCRVNLQTGKWADFAADKKGGDVVSLAAAHWKCGRAEAADRLCERYGLGHLRPVRRGKLKIEPKTAPVVGQQLELKPEPAKEPFVTPVPDNAPTPTFAFNGHGKPTATWAYHDADGRLLFYTARYDIEGRKEVRPWGWTGKRWRQGAPLAPRPLYGLKELAERPEAPVLVVEGEKTANAARKLVPKRVVITWQGGSKAVEKADWTPLAGRDVTVWPDADKPGVKAAEAVAAAASMAGATIVRLVPEPEEMPEGWDLADELPDGFSITDRLAEAEPYKAPPAPALTNVKEAGDKKVPPNLNNTAAKVEELLGHVIKFDEMRQTTTIAHPLPWDASGKEREWIDADDTALTIHLQRQGMPGARVENVRKAVEHVARQHPCNPLRDYLEGLAWDGTPRLDQWLPVYLGAPETVYTCAVGPRFLISAVARALDPGCKVDHVLLLEGRQGAGKSRAVGVLAGEKYFTDHLPPMGTTAAQEQVRGRWIIELAELGGMRKAEVESTKAFLSSRVDVFRGAYKARTEDTPRRCVFIGTVNPDATGYLRDTTGNRRFWPVAVGQIDIPAITKDRDQLWAEAVRRFKAGETWWLTSEEEELAREEQEERRETDEYEDQVRRFVTHTPVFEEESYGNPDDSSWRKVRPLKIIDWQPRDKVLTTTKVAEVAGDLFCIEPGTRNRVHEHRIANALKLAGYEKDKRPKVRSGSDKTLLKWWRLSPDIAANFQESLKAAREERDRKSPF